MAARDFSDLHKAFNNLHAVLKPGGTFIMTIANPYYSFPVGVWKRGLKGFLLRQKPQLKLRPYNWFRRDLQGLHNWKDSLHSYFYGLSDCLNAALAAKFALKKFEDLQVSADSPHFNVQYQLHRFPTIILLAFEKGPE
jgi:SAM-dependent methyltransferase